MVLRRGATSRQGSWSKLHFLHLPDAISSDRSKSCWDFVYMLLQPINKPVDVVQFFIGEGVVVKGQECGEQAQHVIKEIFVFLVTAQILLGGFERVSKVTSPLERQHHEISGRPVFGIPA